MNTLSFLTPAIRKVQRMHQERIASLYAGQQPSSVPAIDGLSFGRSHGLGGNNDIDMLAEPEAWLQDVLADMAARAYLSADEVTFRPLVIELDALGVHFIDALLGAQTRFHGDQVWSDELDCDLQELQLPDLSKSRIFQQALNLARLALEITQGRLFITTPVFACAINASINLFGERLLVAMHERPQAVQHVLQVINDTILTAARAFTAVLPPAVKRNSVTANRYAPPGYGQIDGCATQLISARQYRAFFAALDDALLLESPHGGLMHLCGTHTQHIPAWQSMSSLRSLQLNDRAVDDLPAFYASLPGRIFYVAPTLSMPIEKILQVSGGRRLILQTSLPTPISVHKITPER